MSALAPPAPSSVTSVDTPPEVGRRRRALLGFVATRRIVEIFLTVILGVAAFIDVHLKAVAGGKTYARVSALSRTTPTDSTIARPDVLLTMVNTRGD